MNNKITIKTYISTIDSKKYINEQAEQKHIQRYRELFDSCQSVGGMSEKSYTVKKYTSVVGE